MKVFVEIKTLKKKNTAETQPPKGTFPYTRQRRAAAAAATYITIYGIIFSGLLPYMVNWVAAAAAARRCRVYGNAPSPWVFLSLVPRPVVPRPSQPSSLIYLPLLRLLNMSSPLSPPQRHLVVVTGSPLLP